ncbi:MAG: DUF3604 domain-containing protein [marine benthic group bacterium]|nr:DUF3604 domain-containing protein [Gemmatimonadota bacterium]
MMHGSARTIATPPRFTLAFAALFLALPVGATAQVVDPETVTAREAEYSPYLGYNYPDRVFFGDTHLHTSFSTDAGMVGNVLGPDEAYRFAKGEIVTSSAGVRARLLRPLDWMVVADHAENLGLANLIAESDSELLKNDWGREVHDMVKDGRPWDAYAAWGERMTARDDPLAGSEDLTRTMWERITEAAETHYEPGRFTAFIGYEWTSSPDGNNLHRNVIFRDGKDQADQIIPMSQYDSTDPEDLWDWMEAYQARTGGSVFALAHNGNLSNGLMFDDVTFTGDPLSREYAERRSLWEPLYEVTQIKGDGEAHPALSPNDEFADFESWDRGSFAAAKDPDMIPREYAREALKRGLAYHAQLGANPFRFGMVGSTDSHTSLATTTEDNFFGKATPAEPGTEGRFDEMITGYMPDPEGRDYAIRHYQGSASGLAAVWARENTREALWDAMERKEVYATTGTRMIVRVFAGWDFEEEDLDRWDFAATGYQQGVPMGGELTDARGSRDAPVFMIRALRDPDGANLDRIQMVKGWLNAAGSTDERVYDVVWSGNREPGSDGKLPPVGNTVDVEAASYTNAIGEPILFGFWEDPDFDPDQRAFYYVRVLEIPTPRWTTYDAAFFGVERPDDVPASIQERAYTSPIWYTPGG